MKSVIEQLRILAAVVADALPDTTELTAMSTDDETEATRLLGGIRADVSTSISLLAADIERKSARELGTDGLAQRNGFKDAAGFVQDLAGLHRHEAAQLIRIGGLHGRVEAASADEPAPQARSLDALRAAGGSWDAPVAFALARSWLTAAQADALCTALGAPRSAVHVETWREAAIELIGDCWAAGLSPEDLARAARRVRACLDTTSAASEAEQRYEQRSMKRHVRTSGMVHYDIDLDPESDARFYGPIKQLLSPRFDGRLFASREPQVMIAVTTAELRAAIDGQPGIAFLEGRDQPITADDALRMICTGRVTPVLFDETGQTIDLGKDHRFFTHTQRRAIAVRDGGCMYPTCDRPPEDCEYHHINPWAEHPSHRKSEVRDGVLLCRRHHKLLHDHGAAIRRDGGEYRLHWPGKPVVRLLSKSGVVTQLRSPGLPRPVPATSEALG